MENQLSNQQNFNSSSASVINMVANHQVFGNMQNLATIMASATATVPDHFKGNVGDCMAVVMQSAQWGMNPYAIAQKTHLIKGILGYESQLVAAVINSSGVTTDRFKFEWFGDWSKVIGKFDIKSGQNGEYRTPGWHLSDEEGLGVKVTATLKGDSQPTTLEVLLAQARVRNSTQWADDPKQQLAYLAQKKWARLYAPDVIMGVYTKDEIIEGEFEEVSGNNASVGFTSEQKNQEAEYVSDEEFQKLYSMKPKIESGEKDPNSFIAFIESKGKLLTDDQKIEIATWAQPQEKTA